MTVQELINKVNKEKPNGFAEADLISFINEIEAQVCDEMGETIVQYTTSDTDKAKTLKVPAPYDKLYLSYVIARVDKADDELNSYANNLVQHNSDYQEFVSWIVREDKFSDDYKERRVTRFRNVF